MVRKFSFSPVSHILIGVCNDHPLDESRRLFCRQSNGLLGGLSMLVAGLIIAIAFSGTASQLSASSPLEEASLEIEDSEGDMPVHDTDPPSSAANNNVAEEPQDDRKLSVKSSAPYIQNRPRLDLATARAASDAPLWIKYLQAIEQIRDVSCAFEIHNKGQRDYTENTSDGYHVAYKYKSYLWDVTSGHFLTNHLVFSHDLLPPHDWQEHKTFFSEGKSGTFFLGQYSGNRYPEARHWLQPHPMAFVCSGKLGTPDYFDSKAWQISEDGKLLILKSVATSEGPTTQVTIELSAEHGWMPRTIEVFDESSIRFKHRYEVDRFAQVDGLWFPVEMQLKSFRDNGAGWEPKPIVRRVVVQAESLKLNQELDAEALHFEFPEGSVWSDQETGERVEGELGMQRYKDYRNEWRPRQ
ncbi:MAG: hypothetical protein JNL67_03815 [Planctomycetaceae bacterium]|nr:hypothetical protein [Planctomycetaceae bacterium]